MRTDLEGMHRLTVVWGTVMFILVAGLTFVGFYYKKKAASYQELETVLVDKASEYLEKHTEVDLNVEEIKITKADLIDEGYLDSLEKDGQYCDGYVLIRDNEYKGYVKCDSYTTKGYE